MTTTSASAFSCNKVRRSVLPPSEASGRRSAADLRVAAEWAHSGCGLSCSLIHEDKPGRRSDRAPRSVKAALCFFSISQSWGLMTGISLESVYNCSSQIPTRDIDGFRKDGKLLRLLQRGLPRAAGLKRKHTDNSFAPWAITLPADYVELVCVSQIVSFSLI